MSIVTKTGDLGTTGLMYNRRVPKSHPRVEAYGAVDELNAALGLARSTSTDAFTGECLIAVQKDLVTLMGELATVPEDLARYVKDGFSLVKPNMTTRVEAWVDQIEAEGVSFKDWAIPGATLSAATLDMARTICRRAERRVCDLQQSDAQFNREILTYLNRLADFLWLLARRAESDSGQNEP